MTTPPEQWALGECSGAIATRLESSGRECVDAASTLEVAMAARNRAAHDLASRTIESTRRLGAATGAQAPFPAVLATFEGRWREEEATADGESML